MRRRRTRPWAVASLVLGLSLGCTKRNPRYCDHQTNCPTGQTCTFDTFQCNPTDGGVDADAGDARDASDVGETRFRCTTPAQCADGGPDGAPAVCETEAGVCVECVLDGDCMGKPLTPICDTHSCRGCKTDAECRSDPGICMLDGHCATTGEVIY